MGGVLISIKATNASQFSARLTGFGGSLRDYSKEWPLLTQQVVEPFEAKLFEAEGSTGEHGKWADLSPAYLLRKQKKFPGAPIETATGRLKRSLTSSASGDAIRNYFPMRMEFGSRLPYALFQQTGWRPSRHGRGGRLGTAIDVAFGARSVKNVRETSLHKAAETFEATVPPRRVIDPTEELTTNLARGMAGIVQAKARRAGFARGKQLGISLGPGEARLFGQSVLLGEYEGAGTS